MPFWDQPTPALANWRKTLGAAISLNENRPAVNRAAHVNKMSYAAGFVVFARADLGGWFAPTDAECSASISPADDPAPPAISL